MNRRSALATFVVAILAFGALGGCSEDEKSSPAPTYDKLNLVLFESGPINVTVEAKPSDLVVRASRGLIKLDRKTGVATYAMTGVEEFNFVKNREVDTTLFFKFATTSGTDWVAPIIRSLAPLSAKAMLGDCKLSAGDAQLQEDGTYVVSVTFTTTGEVIGHNCSGNISDVVVNYFGGAPDPYIFINTDYYPVRVTVPIDVNRTHIAKGLEAGQCFTINVGLDADDEDELLVRYDEDREQILLVPGHTVMLDGELTLANKDLVYKSGLAGYGFCLDSSGAIQLAPEPNYEPSDGIESVYVRLKSYSTLVTPTADCNYRSSLPPILDIIPMTLVSPHYAVYTYPDVSVEGNHTCSFADGDGNPYTTDEIIVEVNGWQIRSANQPYDHELDQDGIPVLDFNDYQCTFTPDDRTRVTGEVALIYGTLGDYKSEPMSPTATGGYTATLHIPDSFLELDVKWERGAYDGLELQFGFPDTTAKSHGTLECERNTIVNTILFSDDAKWVADFNGGRVDDWDPNPTAGFIFMWNPPGP